MGAPRNRRHLLVPTSPATEPYQPHRRKIEKKPYPRPQDRVAHARALSAALQRAQEEAVERRVSREFSVHGAAEGIYIQFDSLPGFELKLESLEDRRKGIELVAVQSVQPGHGELPVQRATVFIPDGALKHFFTKFEEYATKHTKKVSPGIRRL